MKVMILGLGKTGTTALLYKVAGGLPNSHAFSGGKPGKYVGDYENAVYKHTYSERKGKTFDLFQQHLAEEHYDRMIWIARDPRDAAVSEMLFRWHRGYLWRKRQYQAHLDLVLKKEADPKSVPFHVICRYAGRSRKWPIATEEVVETERVRYAHMAEYVKGLGPEWFLFKYEDMIGGKYSGLNRYLGFEVEKEGQVPEAYGKVVRKRATGDWRHWFTDEDVELFKPAYLPYMELIGYDCDDWALTPTPSIEPQYSSVYMQSLPKRVVRDTFLRHKDRIVQRLFGK
ncbi:MAG TPA: hypothetical protein VMU60_03845 [Syntrophobacteria bacterium]|nr:hypothetical protein [Syntrophobacteria bacterium]